MSRVDLFTPEMPTDLVKKLEEARVILWCNARDIDKFLTTFLFEDTWAECNRTYEVETKKGTETVHGTPDFNEFDRRTHRYEKQVSKLRWLLWDIHKAASGHVDDGGSVDG